MLGARKLIFILILPFLLAAAQNGCGGSSNCGPQPVLPSRMISRPPSVSFSPMYVAPNRLQGYNCQRPNGYYPVSSSCNSFVECRRNTAVQYNCPSGLHYNPNTQWPKFACSHPSEVNCPTRIAAPAAQNGCGGSSNCGPQPVLPSRMISRPPSVSFSPMYVAPNRLQGYNCQRPNGYYPVSSSCNSFVECRRNTAVQYDCPSGLHYNPNTQWPKFACSHPSEVNCPTRIAAPAAQNGCGGSSNCGPQPVLPSRMISRPSSVSFSPMYVAPNRLQGYNCQQPNGYYPVSSSCNSFVECKSNAAVQYDCPSGLHYNPNTQWPQFACSPPSEVNCPTRIAAPAAQNGCGGSSNCGPQPVLPSRMISRPPSVSFSPMYVAPNRLQGYNCQQPNGYYPVSSSCNSFVECKSNAAVQYDCPSGLHYNPNTQWPQFACSPPSEVNCPTRTQNTRPTQMCPQSYGFFPATDSGDCGEYLMCQGGRPSVRNCPNGLAFDFNRSTCDSPVNVPSCM